MNAGRSLFLSMGCPARISVLCVSLKGITMLGLQTRPVRPESAPRPGRVRGRGLLGKFWTSAAVLGIVAGGVSVSLVVAPPSHALAIAPLVPPLIEGATEAIGGEVITGALVSNPIGWGILAVGAVGIGLYATKDYWLPWVAGQFGSGNASQPSGTPSGSAYALSGLLLTNVTLKDSHTMNSHLTWNAGAGSNLNAHFAYIQECQYATSSGIGDANGYFTINNIGQARNVGAPVDLSLDFGCHAIKGGVDYYGTPVALKVGLAGTDGMPALPTDGSVPSAGPTNEVMYGAFKSGQFSPTDPNTRYTVTVECISTNGTKSSLMRDTYGDKGAIQFPSCEGAGLGHGTGVISITGTPPTGGTPVHLWDTTAPPVNPAEPLCSPALPSEGCAYSISIDGKPCVVGDVQCENWPSIARSDTSTPPRVSCNHGPYIAVLAACNILEKAYFPGGAPATIPNTDGDPGTSGNTDPNGTPIPQPAPVQTGTIPGGAGQPGAGASPNPADTNGNDCFPNGWGVFNPVEWIQKPIGCALSWAFVPQGTTMTQLEAQVKTDVDRVGFGPIQAAVVGMFAPLGTLGSGCQGPPVTFAMHGQSDTIYPFQACTAPMSTAAFVCNALTTMIFIIGGGMGLMRAISAAFGYNFSFGQGSAS